jgi:hypothetical protein
MQKSRLLKRHQKYDEKLAPLHTASSRAEKTLMIAPFKKSSSELQLPIPMVLELGK